jgi:hypothetical protein
MSDLETIRAGAMSALRVKRAKLSTLRKRYM